MPIKASGRYSHPLLGSRHAAGGLLEDAPVGLVARRDITEYFNDFLTLSDFGAAVTGDGTAGDWTVTDIGTVTVGTAAISADSLNGILTLVPDATDNEGYHIQQSAAGAGEFLVPAAGRTIYFEARVGAGDPDGQDFFIGLAETNSTLLSAAGAVVGANVAGFLCAVADAGIPNCVSKGATSGAVINHGPVSGTAMGNAVGATNANFHKFGLRIEGLDKIKFYFDGQLVQEVTMTEAFDDGMCISFGNVGSGSLADALYIDYVYVGQTR